MNVTDVKEGRQQARARISVVRNRPGWLAGLALAAAVACSAPSGRLAVVGGHPVTVEQLNAFVAAQAGRTATEVTPELTGALFGRLLEEEVLLAAAPAPGDHELSPTARSARARELMASLCPPPPRPTEAQVDAYLAAHPEIAGGTDRVKLRQLVLPDEATARAARDRARAGEDFVALSRELSRAPNAADGGVLGWVDRGQLPPEFEAAVAGLAPGDVSEPVPSNAGWHVFQVMERHGAGDRPDAALRERARARLAAGAAETAQRTCLAELAARVGVRVDCAGAAFPCRNPFEGTS
jgi:parvulin-like peptidyl-prolyl isomerase